MATAVEAVKPDFASIVGDSRVVSDPSVLATFAVDGRVPRFVIYAPTAEQVAETLKCAAMHNLAVIPCRNRTKLCTGNPPSRYDVALSTKEMNNVWHYEPADLTITAEAGMKFGDLQHFLARDRLWLPLDPPGGPKSSLGGILSSNASGPLRLLYGGPRDVVLGMKIATAEGKIVKTGGRVVKNVAGYDLGKLLIGSYGTLGVIVEASFKLFPQPAARATFVLPVGTLGIARDLRRSILDSPLQPARMVLLNDLASHFIWQDSSAREKAREPELWVEAHGSPRVIERTSKELEILGRAVGAPVHRLDESRADQGWSRISDFASYLHETQACGLVLKAALPLAASEEFLSRGQQEVEGCGARAATLAQVGLGIVHVAILHESGTDEITELAGRLRRAAVDLGGALVMERASVEIKSRMDAWGDPGESIEVMRKLKAVWDPKGILAPGRHVGGI